jgi:hypothetical protein
MAEGGFSRAAIEKAQQIKKPRAKVREEKKLDIELPMHNKDKATVERHPAIVSENQLHGCLLSPNGPIKHSLTC